MLILGKTDVGTVRRQNQDACDWINFNAETAVATVCDGMGGALSGNIASGLALTAYHNAIKDGWRRAKTQQQRIDLMLSSLDQANQLVFSESVGNEECRGMGTTLVSAFLSQRSALVLNIGDSRAYLFSEDGYRRITNDHSYVQWMLDQGSITQQEALHHPDRNVITRAIGTSPKVTGDVFELTLKPGDVLLLCSDGLSNVIDEQEMLYELLHGGSREDCCDRLLEIAKKRGAPDNLTVILIFV